MTRYIDAEALKRLCAKIATTSIFAPKALRAKLFSR